MQVKIRSTLAERMSQSEEFETNNTRLFRSQNSVKWCGRFKDVQVNRTDLEYAFGRYGRINVKTILGGGESSFMYGEIEFDNSEDAEEACEAEVVILGEKLHVTLAELDPDSEEFKSKSEAWRCHVVKTQERRYVFSDVSWAMYDLVPVELRPKFWVDFNREGFVCKREVIYHYMVTLTVESMARHLLKSLLECPAYKSLCHRVEGALNGFYTFSVNRIYDFHDHGKSNALVFNRPAKGCNLFYDGKPFYYHHDVELLASIGSITERLADDGTPEEVKFAKFAKFAAPVDYGEELKSVINDVFQKVM